MRTLAFGGIAVPLLIAALGSIPPASTAEADPVTLSGTVSYQGTYSGDSLYVAALDTSGVDDVTLLDIVAIPADPPPFAHAYSLAFDNTGVASELFVAAFLDVTGGGPSDVDGGDVFGWYDGAAEPAAVSSATSQSGLDFALPRAEIRGTMTFTADQSEARVDASTDPTCMTEGFRPGGYILAPGPYALVGLYPGTYCVSADGTTTSGGLHICYGDPTCVSPTTITLGATEVLKGIDLDFTAIVPTRAHSWGEIKASYR